MKKSNALMNFLTLIQRIVTYNFKIIFANKFIYFLGAALLIFVFVTVLNLVNAESNPSEATVFWLLLVPGILFVFYPTTFGIQNDVDTRMIEILFGIPNYRYKVWLLRLLLIFVASIVMLYILGILCSAILIKYSVSDMILQILFPILFLGCASFMVSTLVKNGSGTAVIMAITGSTFWVARSFFEDHRTWDVFLNPYNIPDSMNAVVWSNTVFTNRVYLSIGIIATLLTGLLNLQKREKFLQ